VSEIENDWLALWQELAEAMLKSGPDADAGLVERFRAQDRGRSLRPDGLLQHVLATLGPGSTVLELGAGTGRWTIPMARVARRVTALEPSPGMEEMLRANMAEAGADNIDVVAAGWQDADVGPHDVSVAAHSMYTSPDLEGFVRFMERRTRRTCFMELRILPADGVIGDLARRIHGSSHDSPDAVIAWNALYTLGICANVLVEDDAEFRIDASLDDALRWARSHLRSQGQTAHDELIRSTLAARLTRTDEGYRWPDRRRSALMWWRPSGDDPPDPD
jgi:SAM-dependent methyltransferase